jgi:hypothetical protein
MRAIAWAFVALLSVSGAALGQTNAAGGPTPSPPGAAVYFIDLKDGATIPPKTTVHFGLHGMGIAPAGSDKANSGHHHLLIDADLPPLDEPIPSDPNHMHFGAGQTEVDLELSPGPHTLQLLLGDKNHVPHTPPVMSERIHVTVAETPPAPVAQAAPEPAPAAPVAEPAKPETTAARHPSAAGAKVYIVSPVNGATVPLTTTVRFGLINMGIAPAGVEKANSGHHHLMIDTPLPPFDEPIPSDANHLHFGAGQTEATITLTPGKHTLQLLLGDASHVPHDPPVFSEPITVFAGEAPAPQPSARRAAPAPKHVVHEPARRYYPQEEVVREYRYTPPRHRRQSEDGDYPAPHGYAGQNGSSMYNSPTHGENPW